jgi:hypothetical protein
LFYSATGFVGVNAIVFYSGQASKPWYYIELLFSVFICLGGFCGIAGSCFVSDTHTIVFLLLILLKELQTIFKGL